MIRRRTARHLANIVLAALLFAQAAFVASACQLPDRAAALAISSSAEPPCHEEARAPQRSVCVAHCLADFQSLDKPSVYVPQPPLGSVLAVAAAAPPFLSAIRIVAPGARAAGPPPRILFRTLLI